MSGKLRKELFKNYREGQGKISSASVYEDSTAQWPYYEEHYSGYIQCLDNESDILEVGSGPGSLLSWLDHKGLKNIVGIDASPGDVEFSNSHIGRNVAICADGLSHMRACESTYDAILMKAILEHQPKEDLLAIIEAAAKSLKPGGFLLIDVPNMDWLFAAHERYMDLTHEVGFTRESLTSLLQLRFDELEVIGSRQPGQGWFKSLVRRVFVKMMRYATYILGEGAGNVLFESRSIIAVARRPRG